MVLRNNFINFITTQLFYNNLYNCDPLYHIQRVNHLDALRIPLANIKAYSDSLFENLLLCGTDYRQVVFSLDLFNTNIFFQILQVIYIDRK